MSRSFRRKFDHLRIPVAPPSKRMKSGKDYTRIKNYLEVDSYLGEEGEADEDDWRFDEA